MGSFSIWHWLIVLVIILLIFGTKKLRNVGQDLGGAVKGFKDGLKDGEAAASPEIPTTTANSTNHASPTEGRTIEGQATKQ